MSDPNRLLDDPSVGPYGRVLLDSASNDAPDAMGRERVAKRLGIAAGLTSSAVAGGSAVATALTATAIVIGLGAVLGVAVSGSDMAPPPPVIARAVVTPPVVMTPMPPATVASTAVASPAPTSPAPSLAKPSTVPSSIAMRSSIAARPLPPPTPPPVTVAVPDAPSVALPPPSTTDAPPPDLTPPVASPPPAPPSVPIDARRLAAEVASLDRARERLRRHDGGAALALLDAHDREFGGGVLIAEASVVRLEALILEGRVNDARRLADSFLSRFPRSPLVQRVRSLRDSVR